MSDRPSVASAHHGVMSIATPRIGDRGVEPGVVARSQDGGERPVDRVRHARRGAEMLQS